MSSAVERFDDKARDAFDRIGQNEVYVGELQRHRVYTRFLHWMVALFFFLALFTGFGIYLPWLFRWFTPIFGGGARARELHPWFGVGFVTFFSLQVLNWIDPMKWTRCRLEMDAQSAKDRRRKRENGAAGHRIF